MSLMLAPDVLPAWFAIPAATGLWLLWGVLILRDRAARRRRSNYEAP